MKVAASERIVDGIVIRRVSEGRRLLNDANGSLTYVSGYENQLIQDHASQPP